MPSSGTGRSRSPRFPSRRPRRQAQRLPPLRAGSPPIGPTFLLRRLDHSGSQFWRPSEGRRLAGGSSSRLRVLTGVCQLTWSCGLPRVTFFSTSSKYPGCRGALRGMVRCRSEWAGDGLGSGRGGARRNVAAGSLRTCHWVAAGRATADAAAVGCVGVGGVSGAGSGSCRVVCWPRRRGVCGGWSCRGGVGGDGRGVGLVGGVCGPGCGGAAVGLLASGDHGELHVRLHGLGADVYRSGWRVIDRSRRPRGGGLRVG
jgi:hypothetical protein